MTIAEDLAKRSAHELIDAVDIERAGGEWINSEWQFADGSRGHFAHAKPILIGDSHVFSHYEFECVN